MMSESINTVSAQSCNGSWASSMPLSYDCISGEWIGSNNPSAEPPGCPVTPVYNTGQTNTFTFTTPVSSFSIDFNAFSTNPGCGRLEVRINGIFYNLTAANLVTLPTAGPCTGSSSYLTLDEGYITSNATSDSESNAQGTIMLSGINATSVTLSTNDPAGSVFTNPYSCMIVTPIKLEYFTAIDIAGCKAMLSWASALEADITNIEVLRSENGTVFKKVTELLPKGSNSKYSLITDNPSDAYFRLKINDLDGNYEYSEILKVKTKCDAEIYSLTPNPAHNSITITGAKTGDKMFVLDFLGRTVLVFSPVVNAGNLNIQALGSGIYNLRLVNKNEVKANLKFVKN